MKAAVSVWVVGSGSIDDLKVESFCHLHNRLQLVQRHVGFVEDFHIASLLCQALDPDRSVAKILSPHLEQVSVDSEKNLARRTICLQQSVLGFVEELNLLQYCPEI